MYILRHIFTSNKFTIVISVVQHKLYASAGCDHTQK